MSGRAARRRGSHANRTAKLIMKIHHEKHRLTVSGSDLSGSVFDDVNLSGCTYENVNLSGGTYHNVNLSGLRLDKANLAGVSISNCRMDGMTIDGIEVNELLAAWREREAGREANAA